VADLSTAGERPTVGRETGGLFPFLSGICRCDQSFAKFVSFRVHIRGV
jgi:hypothetical protein